MRPAAFPYPGIHHAHRRIHHAHLGFTLIELIVAIAVAAIIATMGVPSFQRFTARNEVAAEVMRIKTALALARSAAITRRTQVTLCPSLTLEVCGPNGEWKGELAIFIGDGSAGDAELLRTLGGIRVASLTYRDDRPVRYGALGRAGGHFGTFRICGKLDEGAKVIINIMGRVRVESGRPSC